MLIKRLFNAVERRGDIGRRVAALVLPISNRPRVTSSCSGKFGLREPGEHTSGPNLASRDNVAHNPTAPIPQSDRITAEFGELRGDAAEIFRHSPPHPSLIEGIPLGNDPASLVLRKPLHDNPWFI
jgi:hypothetical protein